MSDEQVTEGQETGTETEDEGTEEHRILSLSEINSKLDQLFEKITGLGKGRTATRQDDAADVGQQVKSEVAKLKAAEDAKKKASDRDGTLAELQAQVKKLTEKAPVEYRKITRALWGDPDD